MTFPGHNPNLFKWKKLRSEHKLPEKNGDIDQWRKRVEIASEFAVSEVFSHKKHHSVLSRLAVPLQSSEQLRDHDDAYSEAQALLSEWLNSKLRVELEMEDEDDLICSAERSRHVAQATTQPSPLAYNNFNDLYNCLAEEEEQSAVNNFLQDLMAQEVLDPGMMEELQLDDRETRKRFRDPFITMEARHQQVRENRARREAERQRLQREKEAQRDAIKEAKRREREEEMRQREEERRQEEMVQQEMVRLRRQMEERRGLERLVRQRERERAEVQRETGDLQPAPTFLTRQPQQDTERLHQENKIQAKVYMTNLKVCLQRHFSGWYSVALDRKLCMDKAVALCDWRRQLKAWRAWRTVVWAERKQREVARTEEALRKENRQHQLAVESDRRRLLRRCLNEWHLWGRTEKQQRKHFAQQQEIKSRMAALLSAASAGKLTVTESPSDQPITAFPELLSQSGTTLKHHYRSRDLALNNSAVHQDKTLVGTVSRPFQPWQVTRGHTVPTAAQFQEASQRMEGTVLANVERKVSQGSRFENRHTVQQQIITQQRKLLKEQQEQIARLKEKQKVMGLELEMEKTEQLAQLAVLEGFRPKSQNFNRREQSVPRAAGEPRSQTAPSRKTVPKQTSSHPIITAMEARAQQRAERRKEVEELKRKKEEEKLAELKAAEQQRQREEEEEKRKAVEKRREEKRLEREREEEKQRQLKRQQELMRLACQHYHKTLLLRRGMTPWKRLIQFRNANMELAKSHHKLLLLRHCVLRWQQSARESLSKKEALADQLHQHFLLRRSLSCWKRLRDIWMIQEERAKRLYRRRTLRKFLLALLDHVTQEKLVEWDHQELAHEHNNRRVVRQCFLAWRNLPSVLRKERERDGRREKLIRKVVEVLPDFCPHPL
ncbi:coiled-coil domain-containing protein 191 [Melanotaenia boesemani]|uniref:coiled-coil domain-containing protein 191 n=1 Tax=Melanotaenia boesemani TaxID=1250792 RepID=UPI001C05606A|nr:coiled-coil domain-containing protein 191 [Melanotaenia boesemani]